MEEIHKWLELKKKEWKKELEKTKDLGTVDIEILDVMSALLDGVKVRERKIKNGGAIQWQ